MSEIFYVEDDVDIAQAVKEYFEQLNYKVTVFTRIEEAKKALLNYSPTIILIDWNMPDGQGDNLCGWIRTRWEDLPIIFLTVRSDTQNIISGFQRGADDYVCKPFSLEILHSRMLAVLRRSNKREEHKLYCDDIILDKDRLAVFYHQEEVILSSPEYQLLLTLMENKGKTVTRKQLLEQIWDSTGNYVNDNTLTVTMKRLREKLHNPICLKTIRSFGYRMEDTI
ncbi:MAG: response regulator transcription factor [Lachnospiraceae bacterium]|nr:response regulator transcription factor [Lachnospiraceae bacterium]